MARRSKENAIDWGAIERQFRLGQKSNKQLGEEFGVDHSTIGKKAKALGWVVDKSEEVEAVTNSLLIQDASGTSNPNSTPSALEIKAAARANADVVLGHRRGLARLAAQRDRLLQEQELMTVHTDVLQEFVELTDESGPDEKGRWITDKKAQLQQAILSHPDRVESLKKLAEIDERIRKGEREAFGIDKTGDKPASPYEVMLTELERRRRG